MESECRTLYKCKVGKCRSLSYFLNFTHIKHPSELTVFHILLAQILIHWRKSLTNQQYCHLLIIRSSEFVNISIFSFA
jgi:hypothetical protein